MIFTQKKFSSSHLTFEKRNRSRMTEYVTPFSHKVVDEKQKVADTYASAWTSDGTKDEQNREKRMTDYEKITNAYYNLATDFYEFGWGKSFHFAPMAYGESLDKAIARHEHYLALKLNLTEGMVVADLGCGVGGPMREIATFTGAKIVGVNNNAYQCKRGEFLTKQAGLTSKCSFVKGDFMKLSFSDASFDAVYGIEAICHAPELTGVYSEIFRILKPGSLFGCYEWCMTEKFDPTNPKHLRIKKGIEIGDGIGDLRTETTVLEALRSTGFEIVTSRDMCNEGVTKWYQPLDNTFSLSGFQRSRLGGQVTDAALIVLEAIGIAPAGTRKTSQLLLEASEYLVQGAKEEIFTPMFFFVARKPL